MYNLMGRRERVGLISRSNIIPIDRKFRRRSGCPVNDEYRGILKEKKKRS
jgi:hypothetical protein